jgi:nucleoid-associated protein YgaU
VLRTPAERVRMATKYQVASDDTFPSLARRFYSDTGLAQALAAANRTTATAALTAGQELVIPYITQRHTVVVGDTLFDLAELYYGNGAMFPVLSAANHINEPHLIAPGQRLLIPDLVNVSRHTVYPGDTLGEFAMRWYNDPPCARVIEHANRLAGQDDIEVGQTLLRPGLNRRHTVEEHETWAQLTQCWYGDPTLEQLIAAANHLPIELPPPVGNTLFLPDLAEF